MDIFVNKQPVKNIERKWWSSALFWVWLLLITLAVGMVALTPLFAAWFPQLDRPVYTQSTFLELLLSHIWIVALSSVVSTAVGVGLGVWVVSRWGKSFRPLLEMLVAIGQTIPPVAVLAIAVPLIGFGVLPAIIALTLYGLLPIVEATIAAQAAIPHSVREAAQGLGMTHLQRLYRVDLPLALPVVLAGIRTSVTINIGTAAIASTVGAKTLGTPIVVGLTGYNTAYVIQGAVLVGLLAIGVDLIFEKIQAMSSTWRTQVH